MSQPSRTYDETKLLPLAVDSLVWARTWVRTWLRDRPEVDAGGVPVAAGQPTRPRLPTWPEFSRGDIELDAALLVDAVVDTSTDPHTVYYRPHFTAARLYLGDPSLWKSRQVDGSSETRRDPTAIVEQWLAQGRAFDALMPAALLPLPTFVEVTLDGGGGGVDEYNPPSIPLIVGGL